MNEIELAEATARMGSDPAKAEASTLASFVIDKTGEIRRKIMDLVSPKAFCDDDVRTLAEIAWKMHERGDPIDAVTLFHEATKVGMTGAAEAIGFALNAVPSAINGPFYAGIVQREWRSRWLMREAIGLQELVLQRQHDPLELARTVRKRMDTFIEKASDLTDRSGGANELGVRLGKMASGEFANVDLPGMPVLSKLTRCGWPGSISMLCGTPGDGKTWAILSWLFGWGQLGMPARVLMMEETRAWHLHRAIAFIYGDARLLDDTWVRSNGKRVAEMHEESRDIIEALGAQIDIATEKHDTLDGVASWIETQAREGTRMILVDPISAIDPGANRWTKDRDFIKSAKKSVDRYDSSAILVTHPKTGAGAKGAYKQEDLAGGAAFPRFTQVVMLLQQHVPDKFFSVKKSHDSMATNENANRSVLILKSRNARGCNMRVACNLDPGLQWKEYGVVLKEQKQQPEEEAA